MSLPTEPWEDIHVLCIDLSLTMTGWALVRLPLVQNDRSGCFVNPVVACGDIPLKNAKIPVGDRINALCSYLTEVVIMNAAQRIDLVAMEVPQHTYNRAKREMVIGEHGMEMVERSGKGQIAIMAQQRTFGAVYQWLAHHERCRVLEVDPRKSKEALTGNKNASKSLVGTRLAILFSGRPEGPLPTEWSEGVRDALAVAVYLDGEISRMRQGAPSALAVLAQGSDGTQVHDPRLRRGARHGRRQAAGG